MSGYHDLKIKSGKSKFLKIGPGESVDIHILTKSDDVVMQNVHWDGKKYNECGGQVCADCDEKNDVKQRYLINVLDRHDNKVKIFQFGAGIGIGIQEIAKVLREDGQSIHDVDLRVSRVSEKPVRYQVIQRKKAAEVPSDVQLHDLGSGVPF